MASLYEIDRPRRQSQRRDAVVTFLLSPEPRTLLKIMAALCAVWLGMVTWGAIALVELLVS